MLKTKRNSIKRAVAYLRVSTEEQAAEGNSLSAQEQRIRAYCLYKGLELVEVITDAAVSGSRPLADRAGGAEVLRLVRKRKDRIAHVVAFKLDRLFRSTVDALSCVEEWNKAGVSLHLVDAVGQSIDCSTGMGRFFITVLASIAELQTHMIAEQTAAVLDQKRSQGQRVSGHAPYGYRLTEDGKRVEEDPAEQRVLHLVDELHASGMTQRGIAEELERRGIPPRGARWYHITVHRILHRKPAPGTAAGGAGERVRR